MTRTNQNGAVVCLETTNIPEYPSDKYNYSPDEKYPEYPFSDLSKEKNNAYALVRKCLIDLRFDIQNYGTSRWNPLKDYLHPGQTVVIKPNLVMHQNENKSVVEDAMECLVTHPACIRAIVDYCVIALTNDSGKVDGKIIIADAPMQGCHFEELIEKIHLDSVVTYYNQILPVGLVELHDLRQYQSTFDKNKVLVHKEYKESKGIVVNLGMRSMHCKSDCNGRYKVSDYSMEETMSHHNGNHHEYVIAADILSADLIINLSKPKTHRLAGITAALKNMVGATFNKASLPHRTVGAREDGGDAYLYRNWFKNVSERILNKKVRAEEAHHFNRAAVLRYLYGGFLIIGRILGRDNYYIGSWYGNDTIWRTIVDLNYIVKYADKQGQIRESAQRSILYFADMIIAGEGNGPVRPEPKKLGIVCASLDGAALDSVICRIMGFLPKKIPYLKAIEAHQTFIDYHKPVIVSEDKAYNGDLCSICFPDSWSFKPHDAWKEVLRS